MLNNTKKQWINGRYVSIVATYKDDEIGKDYIIYTDETKDEKGKLNVFYGSYTIEDGAIVVNKLESVDEEKKILEILKEITKNAK